MNKIFMASIFNIMFSDSEKDVTESIEIITNKIKMITVIKHIHDGGHDINICYHGQDLWETISVKSKHITIDEIDFVWLINELLLKNGFVKDVSVDNQSGKTFTLYINKTSFKVEPFKCSTKGFCVKLGPDYHPCSKQMYDKYIHTNACLKLTDKIK